MHWLLILYQFLVLTGIVWLIKILVGFMIIPFHHYRWRHYMKKLNKKAAQQHSDAIFKLVLHKETSTSNLNTQIQQGHLPAQYLLARRLLTSDNINNQKKGFQHLKKAANADHALSQLALSLLYNTGKHVKSVAAYPLKGALFITHAYLL